MGQELVCRTLYGIPTMQGSVKDIKPYVDEFIAFAKAHPN